MNALIIGGGVIGLSIARELYIAGVRKITLLDKGKLGREASWAAAGMLAPNAEAERADEFYDFCAASNEIYSEFVDGLSVETGVQIDHRKCGTIEVAISEADAAGLKKKFERQRSLEFIVEELSANEVLRLEPSLAQSVVSGIFYPDDGYVDNRHLVEALVAYLRHNGIEVVENCSVESLRMAGDRVTGAIAGGRAFDADVTILATGAWSSLIKFGVRPMPLDVKPIKGQMVGFENPSLNLQRVIIAPGAYLTPRANGRILVGATVEDVGFDNKIDDEAVEGLINAARHVLPMLERLEPVDAWCGFRPFASDGLPIIGDIDGLEGLFVTTAHFRNGILLAPLTAKIIAEKIVENIDSRYFSVFGPERFNVTGKARGLVN